jgi:hypothetical protein
LTVQLPECYQGQLLIPLLASTKQLMPKQIANATMMALRAVSTERGRDPRDFTLVSFGGADRFTLQLLRKTWISPRF